MSDISNQPRSHINLAISTAIAVVLIAAALIIAIHAAGLSFGQRCVDEAMPGESIDACVQRLRSA